MTDWQRSKDVRRMHAEIVNVGDGVAAAKALAERFPKRPCCDLYSEPGDDPGDCPRCAVLSAYFMGLRDARETAEAARRAEAELGDQPRTAAAVLARAVPDGVKAWNWLLEQGEVMTGRGTMHVRESEGHLVVGDERISRKDVNDAERDERKRRRRLGSGK